MRSRHTKKATITCLGEIKMLSLTSDEVNHVLVFLDVYSHIMCWCVWMCPLSLISWDGLFLLDTSKQVVRVRPMLVK